MKIWVKKPGKKTLEINPRDAEAWNKKGLSLFQLGGFIYEFSDTIETAKRYGVSHEFLRDAYSLLHHLFGQHGDCSLNQFMLVRLSCSGTYSLLWDGRWF